MGLGESEDLKGGLPERRVPPKKVPKRRARREQSMVQASLQLNKPGRQGQTGGQAPPSWRSVTTEQRDHFPSSWGGNEASLLLSV